MVTNKLILLVACCTAASGAMAQQMYKTVGRDGKVTFSDRPAFESSEKLSVMNSYTLGPVELAKPAAEATRKKAEPSAARPDTRAPGPTVTPEVEGAMVTIMGLVEFDRKFHHFCKSSEAGAKAFSAATAGWSKRNAQYIEHQKRLLMEVVSPNKRAELLDRAAVLLSQEAGKIAARTPASRQQWCVGVIDELASGRSDIAKPAMLAVPITTYRAK
jgi:hypothetical protein